MLEPLSDERVQSIVSTAIDDALRFIEDHVSHARILSQRYFLGEVDVEAEDGHSQVVATKCRDAVRAVKPALMRTFLQTDKIVEFAPTGPEDAQAAEQATEYLNWYLMSRGDGYRVIYNAFHDALVKKTGIVKAYHVEKETRKIHTLDGVSPEEFTMAAQSENVEVLEYEQREDGTLDAKIVIRDTDGEICIESVPPEEFFVDESARGIDDFYVIGHRRTGRIADLLDMGFSYEDVHDLDHEDDELQDLEDFYRRGYEDDRFSEIEDPTMRPVVITEAYMRMDIEGTGAPMLYQFLCGGDDNRILRRDLVDEVPFAVFEVDPEPHSFFGRSLVEIIRHDQDAATAMLRGVIDNAYKTNNPRTWYDQNTVNADDALNNEIGAIGRVNGPPAQSIYEQAIPFVAGTILPFLEYYDAVIDTKTGVSRVGSGFDGESLRGATATAADMMRSGAENQTEIMARNLAEGMRQLFRLLLRLMHRHMDQEAVMRISGGFVPVSPQSWNVDMDMSVNVGLGTGHEDRKSATLREMLQFQMTMWAQGGGPQNGLVSMTNIRNTLADIMNQAGIRNADRYFLPMTPEIEQQKLQEAQAAQQQQQADPNAAIIQIEQMKAQARAQTDMQRIQADMQKAAMQDDRERDKMDADVIIKSAELMAKYGAQVNKQEIAAAQAAPRMPPGM